MRRHCLQNNAAAILTRLNNAVLVEEHILGRDIPPAHIIRLGGHAAARGDGERALGPSGCLHGAHDAEARGWHVDDLKAAAVAAEGAVGGEEGAGDGDGGGAGDGDAAPAGGFVSLEGGGLDRERLRRAREAKRPAVPACGVVREGCVADRERHRPAAVDAAAALPLRAVAQDRAAVDERRGQRAADGAQRARPGGRAALHLDRAALGGVVAGEHRLPGLTVRVPEVEPAASGHGAALRDGGAVDCDVAVPRCV